MNYRKKFLQIDTYPFLRDLMFQMKKIAFAPFFYISLLLGIASGTLRDMEDNDIWFQLLSGRYFLENWKVPHTDFFLYFEPAAPQHFGGWGFGVLYELAVRSFGFPGATALNSIIWTSAFIFAIRAAMLRGVIDFKKIQPLHMVALAGVVALAFISIAPRMSMRAESTLFLAWTFSIWLFEVCKSSKKVWLFQVALPFVGLLEAFLHTGGFLLLALVPICAARDDGDHQRSRGWWAKWGLCLIALALLPIANPNGAGQVYTQLISIVSGLVQQFKSGPGGALVTDNLEYMPIWDARGRSHLPRFALGAMLCVIACVQSNWKKSAPETFVFIVFFIQACQASRGITFAVMAALIPAIQACLIWCSQKTSNTNPIVLKIIALLLCMAPTAGGMVSFNFGVATSVLQVQQLTGKIRELRPNGANIFTTEGGPRLAYLLGTDKYKVSHGGHALMPNLQAQEHFIAVAQATLGWQANLLSQKVDLVCVPAYLPLPRAGMFYWLPNMLVSDPRWKMWVINNSGCFLFEKLSSEAQLSKGEVRTQTIIYLTVLRLFKGSAYYGESDAIGHEMAKMAENKLRSFQKELRDGPPGGANDISDEARRLLNTTPAEDEVPKVIQ